MFDKTEKNASIFFQNDDEDADSLDSDQIICDHKSDNLRRKKLIQRQKPSISVAKPSILNNNISINTTIDHEGEDGGAEAAEGQSLKVVQASYLESRMKFTKEFDHTLKLFTTNMDFLRLQKNSLEKLVKKNRENQVTALKGLVNMNQDLESILKVMDA